MREWLKGFLDLALPPACCRCGGPISAAEALCRPCDRALPRPPEGVPPPRGLDGCIAGVAYEGEAGRWIQRFKYPRPGISGFDPAAQSVARAFIREAAARVPGPPPELLVPVPLHPRRLRSRGFSPAALLARALARELRLPLDPVALRRLRDTASQTRLDRRGRRRNVRGAFQRRRGLRLPERVWLVDDIVTTGSTLSEAARELRRSGAGIIIGVCAARTPDPGPCSPSRRSLRAADPDSPAF